MNRLIILCWIFSMSACSEESKEDQRTNTSYISDSDEMVAEPASVAGAFLTCKMDSAGFSADNMEKGVGISCNVSTKDPVFDWQFFCKDKNGNPRELPIHIRASEQVSDWKLLVPYDVFEPSQGITIMALSNTGLANGMPTTTDNMHAVESISSSSVDEFMRKMGKK